MLSDQFDDLRRLDVFSKLLYDSWLKGLRTLDIYLSKLCDSTWSKMHYNLKRKNVRNNVTNYLNYYIKQCAYNDHLNLPCYYLVSVIIFATPFSVSIMCSWSKRSTFWKKCLQTIKPFQQKASKSAPFDELFRQLYLGGKTGWKWCSKPVFIR